MMDVFERRRDEGRDAALHIHRAAPVDFAVADFARERRHGPGSLVAGGHDVGVACERKMRPAGAETGIEIVDVGRAGFGKDQPMASEAGGLEDVLQKRQRAAFVGRHAFAADERLRQCDGVGWDKGHCGLG